MDDGVHHRALRKRDGHMNGRHPGAFADKHAIKCPPADDHRLEKYLLGQTPFVYKKGKRADLVLGDGDSCCAIILISGEIAINDQDHVRILRKKNIGFVFADSFSIESDDYFEIYIAIIPKETLAQRSRRYLQDTGQNKEIARNSNIVIIDVRKIKVFSPEGIYELLSGARHTLKSEWRNVNINAEEILVTYISMAYAFSAPSPELSPGGARHREKEDLIDQLCTTIKSNPTKNYTSKDMETISGLSNRVLQYSFVRRHGMTPLQWALQMKLEHAREMIQKSPGDLSITRLAEELNFASSSRFTEYYRRAFAETPRQTLLQLRNSKSKTT